LTTPTLLFRESQLQPLLVIFEDLHWIDSETQALLDSLVERLPTARLLLLVNYRPEYRSVNHSAFSARRVRDSTTQRALRAMVALRRNWHPA
jgi:predicted ATPase